MNFNCRYCRKKYSRENKLAEHVETVHPDIPEFSNRIALDYDDRIQIVLLLKQYIAIISLINAPSSNAIHNAIVEYMNWDGDKPLGQLALFVWLSSMLIPQFYNNRYENFSSRVPTEFGDWVESAINAVNDSPVDMPSSAEFTRLQRITETHMTFCRRAKESSMLRVVCANPNQLNLFLDEFQRFLNLGMTWKYQNFCPTLPIDLIWHATMSSPAFYKKLCEKFFRRLLPHCLEENEGHHQARFDEFLRHFTSFHRCEPMKIADYSVVQEDANVFDSLVQRYSDEKQREAESARLEQVRISEREKVENQRREQEVKKRLAEEKARVDAEKRAYNAMTLQQKRVYDLRKAEEEAQRNRYASREESQC